jgi:hypothetical protein
MGVTKRVGSTVACLFSAFFLLLHAPHMQHYNTTTPLTHTYLTTLEESHAGSIHPPTSIFSYSIVYKVMCV